MGTLSAVFFTYLYFRAHEKHHILPDFWDCVLVQIFWFRQSWYIPQPCIEDAVHIYSCLVPLLSPLLLPGKLQLGIITIILGSIII